MLTTRFWIAQPALADVLRILSEFVRRVTERFAEEDIEMPYPHRELSGAVDIRGPPDGPGDPTAE